MAGMRGLAKPLNDTDIARTEFLGFVLESRCFASFTKRMSRLTTPLVSLIGRSKIWLYSHLLSCSLATLHANLQSSHDLSLELATSQKKL